jgi:hypothetical protein
MLRDGIPHSDIISNLGEFGKGLNKDNVISWEKGGYQDWYQERVWLEELDTRLEFARDVLEEPDSPKLREASLAIALKQMYELIIRFNPATFIEQLGSDPNNYSRILNALTRIADIGLRYDRGHTDSADKSARRAEKSKNAAGLTDSMLRQYENEFNLLQRPPLPAELSPGPSQERLSEVNGQAESVQIIEKRGQESLSEVKRG